MEKSLVIISFKYNAVSRSLKIFYNNGTAELYHPVPKLIYQNLMRSQNKAAFIEKYIEFDLHFSRMSLV